MNTLNDLEYQMPEGWWKTFGKQMVKEIEDEIGGWDDEELKDFDIAVKEKYGELRVYCTVGNDTLDKIFYKYEQLSKKTCIRCGRPASWISKGWIIPYCNECAAEEFDIREKMRPGAEWFDMFSEIKKED